MKGSVRRLLTVALDVWTFTALSCAVPWVASPHMACAGINVWTSHGPHGASVTALAIDPTTPSTLYAGTDGSGVFQSTNSGASWSPVNTRLEDLYVFALAIDPATPSTLYAGTPGGGVFQSTNSGTSWITFNVGGGGNARVVFALAIDPTTPSTLYVGTGIGAGTLGGGGGVFSIQQVPVSCVGDCDGNTQVTIDELLTLVNIALGNPGLCPNGVPAGATVDVSLILTAVSNALNGCTGG